MILASFERGTKLALHAPMLVWSLFLVALAGCLLPPSVDEIPAANNQPPRILLETLDPIPTEGPLTLWEDCFYRFFGAVSDPDEADTLYWRVFIDYDLDPRPELSDLGTPLRPEPGAASRSFEFTVDPKDPAFRRAAASAHTIELFVADRPFEESEREPKGRRLTEDDGLIDSFTWVVERITPFEDPACAQPRQ